MNDQASKGSRTNESETCHDHTCEITKPQQMLALNSNATAESLTTLRVEGMDCADEIEALRRALKPVAGIREFKVNLMAGKVTIAHEKKLSARDLILAVGKAGLKARPIAEDQQADASGDVQCEHRGCHHRRHGADSPLPQQSK